MSKKNLIFCDDNDRKFYAFKTYKDAENFNNKCELDSLNKDIAFRVNIIEIHKSNIEFLNEKLETWLKEIRN